MTDKLRLIKSFGFRGKLADLYALDKSKELYKFA